MYRKYFYQKSVKITVAVLCSNLILQNVAFAKSSQKIDSTLSLQQVINTKVAETPLQNRLEIITAWVEQGEDTALKQWGTHHPNEIIAIQKILLL